MAIDDFQGNTYVAFADISGFKNMMRKREKAYETLGLFYQIGYDTLQRDEYRMQINGIFISDCAVLFSRPVPRNTNNEISGLWILLKAIKELNQRMLRRDVMLTTSIAYGDFKYETRLEFRGITKNPIFGHAYVDAYFDNEIAAPKIEPGQCRIIIDGSNQNENDIINNQENLLIRKKNGDNSHLYYYWSVDCTSDIDILEKAYVKAKNSKFDILLSALKNPNGI